MVTTNLAFYNRSLAKRLLRLSDPVVAIIGSIALSMALCSCATDGSSSASGYGSSQPQAHPSEQVHWDWGEEQRSGGSGRRLVRFVSAYAPGEIVVSFGDRHLYYVTGKDEAIRYPIAIPREQDRWQGVTVVSDKKVNPSWTPTATMVAENPNLPRWVPGGHPMNPLGVRALYLGDSTYRIHGTDAPWTIGTAISKGCIRMYNADVLDLYPRASLGAKVTITWDRFAS